MSINDKDNNDNQRQVEERERRMGDAAAGDEGIRHVHNMHHPEQGEQTPLISSLPTASAQSHYARDQFDQDYGEELAAMSETASRGSMVDLAEMHRFEEEQRAQLVTLFQSSPKLPTPRMAQQLELEEIQRRQERRAARRKEKEQEWAMTVTSSNHHEKNDSSSLNLKQKYPPQQKTITATTILGPKRVMNGENRVIRASPTTTRGYEFIEEQRKELEQLHLPPGSPNPKRKLKVKAKHQQSHDRSLASPCTSVVSVKTCLNEEVKEPVVISVLYGFINLAIVLPVIMSFGTIIYKDPAFAPYMPTLVKLTVLSGAVHQLCFSMMSSLPFAVGQVQDAGLIFLSSMASTIVTHCRTRALAYDDDVDVDQIILATATVMLSLCTALLGLGVVIIAKLRLATYIQMLPTPVVGGYLAFIGFFCGQAGLALMAGVQVDNLLQWPKFVQSTDVFMHIVPGILGGLLIYVMINRIKSMFVLPVCILSLLAIFYAVLHVTGTSLEQARDASWVSSSDSPPSWIHTWDYLIRLDLVEWSVFPKLIFTLVSMIAVVALSSSLDVMAIEIELGYPLDINHELQTVGWSNVISGLGGGYTGSYIFSQSIFSLRAGIRRRVNGLVVALCELVILFLPFSPLEYIPSFFFGSLLVMIAIDLMVEWLWESQHRNTRDEYANCLMTFTLIQGLGVEYGILAGLLVYGICVKCGMNVGRLLEEDEETNTKPNSNGSKSKSVEKKNKNNAGEKQGLLSSTVNDGDIDNDNGALSYYGAYTPEHDTIILISDGDGNSNVGGGLQGLLTNLPPSTIMRRGSSTSLDGDPYQYQHQHSAPL
jgi:MFS superfamily sulfate permease-like transporter